MRKFIVLMRGINVGGKNKIAMAELRRRLEQQGFEAVETYIQSGNVVLRSDLDAAAVGPAVETLLSQSFELDTSVIKTLVLIVEQLQAIVDEKPAGFGEQPDTYHSDVIFLMGIDPTEALPAFKPREGVDQIWPGHGVIYSQRLSALRTRSRLSRIAGFPAYKSMTIRSWPHHDETALARAARLSGIDPRPARSQTPEGASAHRMRRLPIHQEETA